LLRILEEEDGAIVISFSAWSATGESDVVAQFYRALAERLRSERIQLPTRQRAKELAAKVSGFAVFARWARLGAEELAPVPPVVKKVATEALSKLSSAASAWTRIGRKDLEAITTLLNGRRVVVFIDDLDRADPRLVPKTLLAMRELLDWPGFSFVLAFDRRAISSALSEYSQAFGDDAQGFLEKVIDVPFEVTDAREEQRMRLAEAAFRACCDLIPVEAIAAFLPILPSQPRRVKLIARMMGALQPSLARHSVEEVDWTGIGLYLVIKEASQVVADWVVKAATAEGVDWTLWARDENERRKKEEEVRSNVLGLLNEPHLPPDADRIADATLRLLRHWDMESNETVLYWVEIAYREPDITLSEFHKLRDEFADGQSAALVEIAIRRATSIASVPVQQASAHFLDVAVTSYRMALDAMAGSHTRVEWEARYADAKKTLLLLEYVWIQRKNGELAAAASQGAISATLLSVVARWLTWTNNDGELSLRQRERELALAVIESCIDPELLFAETDPFWESHGADSPRSSELMKAWRSTVRAALAPRVVTRLCEKFLKTNGLALIAAGDDRLGPWLIENEKSPLYTNADLTRQLVEVMQAGRVSSESVRIALSKNARLYLRQLLFQTRDASWGGIEDAKAIHARHPEIIPAAWAAIIDIPVPFRMQSSLRKLRTDLLKVGVISDQLPGPSWLKDEAEASTVIPSPPPAAVSS